MLGAMEQHRGVAMGVHHGNWLSFRIRRAVMEDENFFEKCRTCQYCFTKNDDGYVYCSKRNGKCEYKPYKLRGEKNKYRNEFGRSGNRSR